MHSPPCPNLYKGHKLTVNEQVNWTLVRCVTGGLWCDVTLSLHFRSLFVQFIDIISFHDGTTPEINNKKAVRYGARNHRAMPLLHISPSSFAQNLEMFGVRSMSSVVQWARYLGNINLFNHSARTLQTDRRTDRITMAIPRFALMCIAR